MGSVIETKEFKEAEKSFITSLKKRSKTDKTSFFSLFMGSDYDFLNNGCYGLISAIYEDECWEDVEEYLEFDRDCRQKTDFSWKLYFITDKHLNQEVYDWVMELFGDCFEPCSFEEGMKNGWKVTFGKGSIRSEFYHCYHASIALRFAINYGIQCCQKTYDLFRPHCVNTQETIAFASPLRAGNMGITYAGWSDHSMFDDRINFKKVHKDLLKPHVDYLFRRWSSASIRDNGYANIFMRLANKPKSLFDSYILPTDKIPQLYKIMKGN